MAASASTRNTSRRRFLAALAATPALAVPAMASAAQGDDAELLALEAEIDRLHDIIAEIEESRVWPYDEEFERIMRRKPATQDEVIMQKLGVFEDVTRETYKAAWAYSDAVGRSAAAGEVHEIYRQVDPLLTRLFDTPARTNAGRAAKVRVLLGHLLDEWRGPARDLDYPIERSRQLLGELSGLTEVELAAI
jgi:hypothetical protein